MELLKFFEAERLAFPEPHASERSRDKTERNSSRKIKKGRAFQRTLEACNEANY